MTTQPTTKAHNLALIVPSPILSETTTTDINREIDRQLERMTDRTTRPIMIRIMSGSNYKHLLHAAKRFDNITIKIHKPNYRNGKPAHNATAKLRAAGNMIAASDYLMVLDGETRAISPTDNDLMNLARKSQIKIINRQIEITPPTPTPEKDQPKKSRPPLLIAEYRVNLNQFTSGARRWETLQDCMDDPIVSHPIAAIYCGRAHKARKAERSPLANPYTQKNSLDPIADFNRYLWTKIKDNDQEIMAALRRITPATPLICYCDHYKACHTDVIRKAASYIAQQDAIKRAQEKRAQRAATSHADANNATVILKDLKKQRETLRQQLAQLDTAIRKAEEQQFPPLTYFISGHLAGTIESFKDHYKAKIDQALANPLALFVVGDAPGIDTIAQAYLYDQSASHRLTVYHTGKTPRNLRSTDIKTKGDFTNYTRKDKAMTAVSSIDIAHVEPGKERSGTARNITRRANS